jgi:hypothetical protein
MDILTETAAVLSSWAETLRQAIRTVPLIDESLGALCIALPLGGLLALAGLGILSGSARALAVTRGRASYEKCARQLAMLAMLLGWVLLIGGRVWLFSSQGSHAPDSLPGFLLESCWMLLGMAVMFTSVYYMLWKYLTKLPLLHAAQGILCGILGLPAAGAALAAARLLTAQARPDAAAITLAQLYTPVVGTPFFCALCMTLPLALAAAGGFGAVWLVLRRRHDDFGRDHYNAMLPWCAAWARNAWLVFWLLLLAATALRIGSQWQGDAFTPESALRESAWLLLWLIPAALWTLAARSATPLRHKPALLAALLLSLAATLPYYAGMTDIAGAAAQTGPATVTPDAPPPPLPGLAQ